MTTKSKARKFLDGLIGEPMAFGSTLLTIRETDDLTQQEVADLLGVNNAYIY